MLVLIALLAALFQQTVQTGTIEGVVLRAGTDFPIGGAQIKVITGSLSLIETVTDGAGRFSLHDIPAGRIAIEINAEGYLFRRQLTEAATVREAGQADARSAEGYIISDPTFRDSVNLAAGESLKLLPVFAVPAAAIRGRIVDHEGNGVPGVSVAFTSEITDAAGRRRLLADLGTATTDERGEYRRDMLSPGDYYVKATLDRADRATLTVYYPATLEVGRAAPVILTEGSELTADITIPAASETNTFKISGRVLPPTAKSSDSSVGLLLRMEGPPATVMATTSTDAETGRFQISDIPPGIYELFATASVDDKEYLAKIPVEIRDEDMEKLEIRLQPGADIKGRLVIEGDLNGLQFSRAGAGTVRINLNREDRLFGNIFKPVIDDTGRAFTFPDVPPGNYTIDVRFVDDGGGRGVSPDLYVADIRAGGRSVFDDGIEVGVDPTDAVEIVIGMNGGAISGTVADLTPRQHAVVVLVPEVSRRSKAFRFRATEADEDGQFQLRGLTPGIYRIFALPDGPPLPRLNEVSQYESRALTVVVAAGMPVSGIRILLLSPVR